MNNNYIKCNKFENLGKCLESFYVIVFNFMIIIGKK